MKKIVIRKRVISIIAGLGSLLALICVYLFPRNYSLNSVAEVGAVQRKLGDEKSKWRTLNQSLPVMPNDRKHHAQRANQFANKNRFQDRQPLSQEEFEALRIPGLSVRSNSLSQSYIEFAEFSEEDVDFIQKSIEKLIADLKTVEISKTKVLEDVNGKKIFLISPYPEEGGNLEGEFRYAFRERFGEWQEDLFMKLNRSFFATWLGDFGKMEQQITLAYPEGGPYRFEVGAAVPINLFKGPKELAGNLHNRLRTQVSFQESFIPERFSHLLKLE